MATTKTTTPNAVQETAIVGQDSRGNSFSIPNPTPKTAITSEALAPTAPPLKLPPVIPTTAAEGTQEYIAAQNKSVRAERQAQLDREKARLKSDRNDIASLIEDIGNSGRYREQFYKEQGVDQAKKEVDDYTSQIEAEQLANNRRQQAIRKNAGGMFAEQVDAEANRVNRESLEKQADLAILQNASLRRYSTASEIADRQLEAKLEPMKAKLDALKFFYAENKADFNKEDDRLYSEMIKEQDREYERVAKKEAANTEILKDAVSLGAPADVIKNIQNLIKNGADEVEVAAAAGTYTKVGRQVYESDRAYNLQKAQADKKSYQFTQDPNGNPVIFDPETGTISNVDLSSIASKYSDGSYGGQCGDFAHRLADFPPVGNSLSEKQATVNKSGISADQWRKEGARPGDVIITSENAKYGHVAVVIKDNGDGTVTVKDSNYGMDEKIRTRVVDMANGKIYGVIRGELKPGLTSQQSSINITKDQRQRLQTEGLDQTTINSVLNDVATVGLDKALGDGSGLNDAQRNAFTEVLRGKTSVEGTQFLSKDYFRGLFTEDQLRSAAAEAGFKRGGSFWKADKGVGEEGISDYLDYLDKLVQQYRAAGFTDKEILEKMK